MHNASGSLTKARKIGTPMRDAAAQSYALGWNDYIAGQPFAPDYETWSEPRQRNYEMGRASAAAARSQGQVPRLRRNHLLRTSITALPAAQYSAVINERSFHFNRIKGA